jgi:hypothetical protein
MQAALNALGIKDRFGNKIELDHKIGPRFYEGILEFARRNGLTVNGQNPGGLTKPIMDKLAQYYQ